MPRYNMSCQCLPGNKPFLPDPRTGLVEGCAPLTDQVTSLASGQWQPSLQSYDININTGQGHGGGVLQKVHYKKQR